MSPHLLYIADPMCSWCWGFSPVIDLVKEHFERVLSMELLMGGLRPGTQDAMTLGMKEDIRGHWRHVQEASGQPFDFAFFDREAFVYDTEPPSRAVVSVRGLDPALVFDCFRAIQRAFYAENRDITDPGTLADIVSGLGLDRETFTDQFKAGKTITETWRDFDTSRQMGVTGFPTLLAGSTERDYEIIAAGYTEWDRVKERIEEFVIGNQ